MKTVRIKVLPAVLGLGAAFCAAVALAAEPTPAPAESKAGKTVDIAEVKARADEAFAKADKNGNGTLDKDEFVTMAPLGHRFGMRHHGAHMGKGPMGCKGMGPEGRGGMGRMGPPSAEERAAMHKELFAALDTDGNGQLSPAEFDKQPEARAKIHRERTFDRLDANKDGALSRDELPSPVARLERADANKDGKLTPDEMRAMRGARWRSE